MLVRAKYKQLSANPLWLPALMALLVGSFLLMSGSAGAQPAAKIMAEQLPPQGWSLQATYPIEMLDEAIASQGNYLYSFSGVRSYSVIADSYRYSPATNSWTPIAPLPQGRQDASAVSDGTYIYILGGNSSFIGTPTTTMFRYDPGMDAYQAMASFNTPTTAQAAAYLNGKIYRIGGCANGNCGAMDNSVEVYTISTNSWASAADYPIGAGLLAATSFNGYVWAAGGTAGGTAKTYRYDPVSDTWDDAAMADLPFTWTGGAEGLLDGQWILAGGYVNHSMARMAFSYDPVTNTWIELPNLPNGEEYNAADTVGTSLYVVGGVSPAGRGFGTNLNQVYTGPPMSTATPTISATPTATPTRIPKPSDTVVAATKTTTPTSTPTGTPTGAYWLVGHVTWQGRPAQPSSLQQLPITLTLKQGNTEVNYSVQETDASGYFTVPVGGMSGTYSWRVKGAKFLANAGNLVLSAPTVNAEMGLMRAGDATNDNIVNAADFNIVRSALGKSQGQPGYDDRADFTGDQLVNVADFNLLRANFGQFGAPPAGP